MTVRVVCCAIAPNEISKEAVMIHFQVRMTQILSLLLTRLLSTPAGKQHERSLSNRSAD